MRSYMLAATIVLVTITSAGAFGFLSGEFQKAIAGNNQQTIIITALEEEKVRLQKRKEEIDTQIARLPENSVRGRTQLLRQFGPEINRLNSRLAEIDQKLPELKVKNIEKEVKVGPIIYVAEAFGTTPEHAVKWVILVIIFVFDPLAIALLLAGNFLTENRNVKEEKRDDEPESFLPPKAPLHDEDTELNFINLQQPLQEPATEKLKEDKLTVNLQENLIVETPEISEPIHHIEIEEPKVESEKEPIKPVQPEVRLQDQEPVQSKSLERIDHSRADVSFSNNRRSSVRSTYTR